MSPGNQGGRRPHRSVVKNIIIVVVVVVVMVVVVVVVVVVMVIATMTMVQSLTTYHSHGVIH